MMTEKEATGLIKAAIISNNHIKRLEKERDMNTELVIELNKTVELLREERDVYKKVAHLFAGYPQKLDDLLTNMDGDNKNECLEKSVTMKEEVEEAVKEMLEMEKQNENTK